MLRYPGFVSAYPRTSLVLCRVTTRSGLSGYGECLCNRPPMQQALVATIRDAIAPLYVGQSVDDKETLNLAARRRSAPHGSPAAAADETS